MKPAFRVVIIAFLLTFATVLHADDEAPAAEAAPQDAVVAVPDGAESDSNDKLDAAESNCG